MKPITIGYYDDSWSRGGTTRYLLELILKLDRARFTPVFFAPELCEWHSDLTELDVEVITFSDRLSLTPAPQQKTTQAPAEEKPAKSLRSKVRLPAALAWNLGLARDIARLARLFQKCPVDLLHLNNTGAESAPVAARLAGIPRIVGTWHVDSTYDLLGERQSLRFRFLERASMHALHHSIAVSHATQRDWVTRCGLGTDFAQNRVTVVHNGINLQRVERQNSPAQAKASLGIEPDALVLGSIGRLDPAKGYEYLIKAMPKVITKNPRAKLVIAGSGPLREELENLACSLGVADSVQFLGFVSDVRSVLECADIYVQPSLCEALGLGIIEAQGMGLPVVASDVGGISEVVGDDVTGYVVPARNPQALSAALISLLDNPARCVEMGQRSKEKIERGFTQEQMVAQTVLVYERVLAKKTRRTLSAHPASEKA